MGAMSLHYTCLTCRLRILARTSSFSAPGQQRWVSQANQWYKHAQNSPSGARNGNIPGQTWGASDRNDERPKGRYSGRPLGPEQLLDELQTPNESPTDRQPAPSRPSRYPRDQRQASRSSRDGRLKSSDIETPLWKLRGSLFSCRGSEEEDEEFWKKLKDVMKTYRGHEHAAKLASEEHFRRKYAEWAMRTLERSIALRMNPNAASAEPAAGDEPLNEEQLTPYQALRYWSYFGGPSGTIPARMLWLQARETAEFHSGNTEPGKPSRTSMLQRLDELMSMWSHCMASKLRRTSLDEPDKSSPDAQKTNWSFLPDPSTFNQALYHRRQRSLSDVLGILVPTNSTESRVGTSNFDIESAAIVTLDLLEQVGSQSENNELVQKNERWISLIQLSLKHSTTTHVPNALARRMMELGDSDARRLYYQSLIDRKELNPESLQPEGVVQRLWAKGFDGDEEQWQPPSNNREVAPTALTSRLPTLNQANIERSTHYWQKQLGRAVEQQNLRGAESVRADVSRFQSRNPGVTIPQPVYEIMIYSFLHLRALKPGLSIWNEMISAGYIPRLKTYTTMMRGSQHLQDLASMEHFWNKMRQDQIQPDAVAWSTRLSGLFRRGHLDAGIAALSELGRDWVDAAKRAWAREHAGSSRQKTVTEIPFPKLVEHFKGDVDGVTRPDVVSMNSAITALARGADYLIPKVLTWGRSFGIEPDLVTYNSLIHVSMRRGQSQEALKVLERMRDRNIQPDGVTMTIILQEMIIGGFLQDLTHQEQEDKVFELISSIEASGFVSLNLKSYALILDKLLKSYENHVAAQAVLAYMISKGVEPSKHIYTILMDSHLQQDPPNFEAAETLWRHIHSAAGGYGASLDAKFFDLVIKGYARHYELVGTDKVMSLLNMMENDGKVPSWGTLEMVSRMLAFTGEWGRLAQIVARTRSRLRDERGLNNGIGQRRFWEFVISTGVLQQERITMPEQIMGFGESDS